MQAIISILARAILSLLSFTFLPGDTRVPPPAPKPIKRLNRNVFGDSQAGLLAFTAGVTAIIDRKYEVAVSKLEEARRLAKTGSAAIENNLAVCYHCKNQANPAQKAIMAARKLAASRNAVLGRDDIAIINSNYNIICNGKPQ